MRNHKGSFLFIVLVLSLSLGGCPKPGYVGRVAAHISPQSVDPLRTAVLSLGGFEGPREMQGADPNCSYYLKRLSPSGITVSVHDCYGPMDTLETGWGYVVSVLTWTEGQRPEVRAEIDALVEDIRKVIQARVGQAKVTKVTGLTGLPF